MTDVIMSAFVELFNKADKMNKPMIRQMYSFSETTRGNARRWFAKNKSKSVHTLQFNIDSKGNFKNVWTPGLRKINRVNSVDVLLDNSHREFRGLKTIFESDNLLVCWTDFGESTQVMAYRIEG